LTYSAQSVKFPVGGAAAADARSTADDSDAIESFDAAMSAATYVETID
jgi:hypothetical protein